MFESKPAGTVLEPVMTVPRSPEIEVANVAQSPEKFAGIASDSCGREGLSPQPASAKTLSAAKMALTFWVGLDYGCICFFRVEDDPIIYIL